MSTPRILGIESSCDETAVAVVRGKTIESNLIASQIEVHREYGGVVPELASRHHLEKIDLVLDLALKRAGVTLEAIDAVAVTYGPGLVGPLLVGLQAAKAIAYVRGVPLLAVNHLEGHLRSVWLENDDIPLPALSLLASGGTRRSIFPPTRSPSSRWPAPGTTPPARPSTRWPSFSASVTPEAR